MQANQVKYFENLASEGSRIGSIFTELSQMSEKHDLDMLTLKAKQEKLFNSKKIASWENAEVTRMTKIDQEELLKDPKNMSLIATQDQVDLWKTR